MKNMYRLFLVIATLQIQFSAFGLTVQNSIATQGAGTLYVGPSRSYATIGSALNYLSDKKITGDITIAVDPGLYKNAEPIFVTHQDAHRITITGNSGNNAAVITLASGAIVSTTATDVNGNTCSGPASSVDYYQVVITISPADVSKVSAGNYVLIRAVTGDLDDAYPVFQGTWEVSEVVANPPQIKIKHKYPLYPFPVNKSGGLLDITGGQIIVLNTVLKFYACPGIVAEGRKLKSLKNLALVGDYRPVIDPEDLYVSNPGLTGSEYATVLINHADRAADNVWGQVFPGIEARLGGNIKIDRYVGVSQFDGQGVSAQGGCYVEADRTASSANERRGFYPTQTAYMKCSETIGSANNTDGYLADLNAVLEVNSSAAAGNKECGVIALHKGRVYVKSSVSSGNGGCGFSSRAGLSEMMLSTTGTAKNWSLHNFMSGVYAADGAEIKMAYTWVKNNIGDGVEGSRFTKWSLGTNNSSYSNGGSSWDFTSPDLVVSNSDYTAWISHSMPFVSKIWTSDSRGKILLLDDTNGPYQAHYTINPAQAQSSTNFKSLNDFFDFLDDYRIQANNKMLNVELAYGTHHYADSVMIDHPDAGKVKIYGKRLISNKEYIEIRILDTVSVTEYSDYCTAVLQLATGYVARADVGNYLNITDSNTDDGSDHELFRGAWEIVAKDVTNNRITVNILQRDSSLVSKLKNATISGTSGGYITARLLKSVLKFYAASGIVISNAELGDLSGVCIIGDYKGLTNPPDYAANPPSVFTNQTVLARLAAAYSSGWVPYCGVRVTTCGAANISGASAVCEFPGSGIVVTNGSVAESFQYRTTSLAIMAMCANRLNGVECCYDSTFQAKGSVASHNRMNGYSADYQSVLYASLSSAIANTDAGFSVEDESMISGNTSEAVLNLEQGYYTSDRSHTSATSSESRANGIDGYYFYDSTGTIEYSDAIANEGNGFSFIESIGRMNNVIADGNFNGVYGKDYDSLSLHKTYLYAPNSLIKNHLQSGAVGVLADKNSVLVTTGSSIYSNSTNTAQIDGGVVE